jgi:hypothetical protein
VASHVSAGRVWGLDAIPRQRIHVSVANRSAVRASGIVLHRPRTLTDGDVTTVGVIPVTTPIRTLVDLATMVPRSSLEDAIDSFIRKDVLDPSVLRDRLDAMAPFGRRGFRMLRELAAERVGEPVAGSVRERRLFDLLRSAGLPLPTKQFRILSADGTFVARPDLSYPPLRIYIEFESVERHTGRRNWERDIARQNALVALGWLPLRITARQMDLAPSDVISLVRVALAGRATVNAARTG